MSSSSDIEKLFDHFGGDANAYQEIGRENEARSARTRWPLLVTLDLTQPTIPAIGQRREARPQAPMAAGSPVAVDRQDFTSKDAASVTRAKAPLFTRSHRRDIPPVPVTAPATVPRGASRFSALESKAEAAPQAASAVAEADAAAPATVQAAPAASAPAAIALRTPVTPVTQTIPAAAPNWAQAPAPTRAYTTASSAPSVAPMPSVTSTPAAPSRPASILGKLFAPQPEAAPPQPAATGSEPAPLRTIFDRLRGTPAQTSAAPAGIAPAAVPRTSNSWLVNGPRRS
ncbi:cellulose biosynthesis protein BcsP [Paraburkholderia xenovorans]